MSKMVVNKNITPPVRSRYLMTTRKQVNNDNELSWLFKSIIQLWKLSANASVKGLRIKFLLRHKSRPLWGIPRKSPNWMIVNVSRLHKRNDTQHRWCTCYLRKNGTSQIAHRVEVTVRHRNLLNSKVGFREEAIKMKKILIASYINWMAVVVVVFDGMSFPWQKRS